MDGTVDTEEEQSHVDVSSSRMADKGDSMVIGPSSSSDIGCGASSKGNSTITLLGTVMVFTFETDMVVDEVDSVQVDLLVIVTDRNNAS